MSKALRNAVFAIPGDIDTLTGGYIYEKRLLLGLRAQGRTVTHVELPAGFPDPTSAEMSLSVRVLAELPDDAPLILDGLVFGSIDPAGLAQVRPPVVAMIHHPLALETGLSQERRNHLYRTERANLDHAAHVLVPSPHTAKILMSDYGVSESRITIARPGTDRPSIPSSPVTPPLILSVGIHHARKGHATLLRALSRVSDLKWQATIVGRVHDQSAFDDLRALEKELDLGPRLRVFGEVPQGELDQLYANATIFALATEYEGYGIVFDEALVRGLPIVSCRTGAVPETVPGETGLLVPVGDDAAFADALRQLLSDERLRTRMAREAFDAGGKLPTWEETAEVAGQVLDQLE